MAHFRLAYSRMFLVIAYMRESQEMLFDAHRRWFEFIGGVTLRALIDNMKTGFVTAWVRLTSPCNATSRASSLANPGLMRHNCARSMKGSSSPSCAISSLSAVREPARPSGDCDCHARGA